MRLKLRIRLTLGFAIASFGAITWVAWAQMPSSPRAPELERLSERMAALDARLKVVESRSEHSAMEADYVQRIQKHYEAYYEKAFNTQLGLLSILGLVLTVLLWIGSRFGFDLFDRQIQYALKTAGSDLRTDFDVTLQKELKDLRERNDASIKQAVDDLKKGIENLEKDLKTRSGFQFQFSQGLSFHASKVYEDARKHFRRALQLYEAGKARKVVNKESAVNAVINIFRTIRAQGKDKFEEGGKKELTDKIYEGLDEEVSLAALEVPELAALLHGKEKPQDATQQQ